MGYVVSSASVDELRKKTPNISRFVTIAGSDYSERVTKWPRISWAYDEIRPKSIKLPMANDDDALGFFRSDKTKMQSTVRVGLTIVSPQIEDYTLSNLAKTDVYSIGEVTGAYEITGTFDVTSGGEYVVGVDDDTDSLFRLKTLVPYQINSATLVDSLNVAASGLPRPRSLAFDQFGNSLFVLDSTNAAIHHFVTSSHILNSATLVGSLATSMSLARGLAVNSDASLMMVFDSSALRQSVHTFVMAAPGSLSTASETAVYSLAADGLSMNTMAVNEEFTRAFFVGGGTPGHMRMYNMTQPGSLGNAVLDPSTGDTQGLTGQNGGDALAVARANDNFLGFVRNNTIYTLTNTQGVVLNESQVSSFTPLGQESPQLFGSPNHEYGSIVVSSGGAKLFSTWEGSGGALRRFNLPTPYDVSSMDVEQSHPVTGYDTAVRCFAVTDDWAKIFMVGADNDRLFELNTAAPFSVTSLTLVNTLDLNGSFGLIVPSAVQVNSDASWMIVTDRADNTVHEFTLSTPGAISTASATGQTLTYSYDSFGIVTNKACDRVYVAQHASATSCWINEYTLPTPGSLAGVTVTGSLTLTSSEYRPYAIGIADDREDLLYIYSNNALTIKTFVNSLPADPVVYITDSLTLFSGDVAAINYADELCTIEVIDKFKALSSRKVGTNDAPVDYSTSNHLGSDLAWYLCTSHGGLSSVTSTSNPDIDYTSFESWSEVFSSDQIRFQALFDGQTPTEGLRKIAKQSNSSIYVQAGKLVFKRIGVADEVTDNYTASELLDVALSFKTSDITNRQLISGNYTQDSGHLFTITQANTTSVNSFGIREDLLKDSNVWFVDSGSAINQAQRMLILNADPDDELRAASGMRGWIRSVGETINVSDTFHGIAENYLIRGLNFDMDTGKTNFELDKILIAQPFRLDVSTLNNTEEVLT